MLLARKTLLGWTISGPARNQDLDWKPSARQLRVKKQEPRVDIELRDISWPPDQRDVHVLSITKLERQPRRQSNADFRDLNHVKREAMPRDDKRAVKDMTLTDQKVKDKHKQAIPRKIDKHKSSIPRKIDPATSTSNRRCAETSPRSLTRKFAVDVKLRDRTTSTVTKYLADGQAGKLKASELNVDKPPRYFPHQSVCKLTDPPKRPSPRSGQGTPTMGLQALWLKASRK